MDVLTPLKGPLGVGPRLALAVASQVRRGAVENARAAAAAIGGQIAERRAIAPEEEAYPGSLTRLSDADCLRLLDSRQVGRLAYVRRPGVPDVVPVNYALHDGALLVRSGPGPKLQAAERGACVALEVDDIDEDAHTGWSVVAVGPAERLTPSQHRALPPGALPAAWAHGPRYAVIRVRPTRLEGRRLS